MNGFPHIDPAAIEAEQGRQKAASVRKGLRGIYFDKQYGKWHVRALIGGKSHHVGRYEKLEDAVTARDEFVPKSARKHSEKGEETHDGAITFTSALENVPGPRIRTHTAKWFAEESKRQLKELPKLYA